MKRTPTIYNQYNYYTKNNVELDSDLLHKSISDIVDRGMSLMDEFLSKETFEMWAEYSKATIHSATNNTDLNLYKNYTDLLLSVYNADLHPYQKLHHCLKYLLELMKIIA